MCLHFVLSSRIYEVSCNICTNCHLNRRYGLLLRRSLVKITVGPAKGSVNIRICSNDCCVSLTCRYLHLHHHFVPQLRNPIMLCPSVLTLSHVTDSKLEDSIVYRVARTIRFLRLHHHFIDPNLRNSICSTVIHTMLMCNIGMIFRQKLWGKILYDPYICSINRVSVTELCGILWKQLICHLLKHHERPESGNLVSKQVVIQLTIIYFAFFSWTAGCCCEQPGNSLLGCLVERKDDLGLFWYKSESNLFWWGWLHPSAIPMRNRFLRTNQGAYFIDNMNIKLVNLPVQNWAMGHWQRAINVRMFMDKTKLVYHRIF